MDLSTLLKFFNPHGTLLSVANDPVVPVAGWTNRMALVSELKVAAPKQSDGVSAFTVPRCVVAFGAGCCGSSADEGNWNDTEFESDVCHSASRSRH